MIYSLVARFLWQLNLSQTYNGFVYSLQKIPYLGKFVKDGLYHTDVKQVMKVFQVLLLIVKRLLMMMLYVSSLLFLALLWFNVQDAVLAEFDLSSKLSQSYTEILKSLIITFSLFTSSLISTDLIEVTAFRKDQITMIKVFRIEASVYYMVREIGRALNQFLTLGLGLGIAFVVIGESFAQAIYFASVTIGSRVFMRSLMLRAYRPHSKIPSRYHNYLGFLAVGLGLFYLWSSVVEGGTGFDQWPFSWSAGLLGLVLGILGFYHLSCFQGLPLLASQLVSQSSVVNWSDAVEEANKTALQVTEKDIAYKGAIGMGDSRGVAYLNKVFLSRLDRPLRKRTIITVLIILGLTLVLHLNLYLMPGFAKQLKASIRFEQVLILSSLIGYIIYMGEYYMKYCFFNLDRHFLKFNYYRKPDFVRETLKARLGISIIYNFPICLALLTLFVSLVTTLYGVKLEQVALLLVFQLISMFFFSLHFLYLYFYFQPFTEQMQSRSLVYTILSQSTYGFFAILLQVLSAVDLVWFFGFWLLCFVYLILAAWWVIKNAPKTFRLR